MVVSFELTPLCLGKRDRYISPLVVSLASLTVPLLAVVEGLMLGVDSPPGLLFGIGAVMILAGAGIASVVTILPHTEVFDATKVSPLPHPRPCRGASFAVFCPRSKLVR